MTASASIASGTTGATGDGYLRVDYGRIGAPFDTWQHWQATGGQRSTH